MAGYGTRLRPHTWSKPKPLVSVAGKATLGHVLDIVATAADPEDTEIAFIIGYHGDQVEPYMQEHYPEIETHYYVQEEMKGQSHAIAMAREQLHGPTLILFVDTIVDTDLSYLKEEKAGGVIWVKEVEDPRRFGVVEVGDEGFVRNLIEKPDSMENNLAIVGYYYFARGEELLVAIDKQIREDVQTKGEFYIADAMKIMIEDGLELRPHTVDAWLDAGLPGAVLDANHYLLDHGRDNTAQLNFGDDVVIKPPVFIHPGAEISNSEIGPHVSIGAECRVTASKIANSVLEPGAVIDDSTLKDSLIGARAIVNNLTGIINIGDDAEVRGS